MSLVFLDPPGTLEEAGELVADALGLREAWVGDSLNVYGGTYLVFFVLGVRLKLEINSYDHADEYRFMVTLSEDRSLMPHIPTEMLPVLGGVVASVLEGRLDCAVALEGPRGLLRMPTGAKE